MVISAWSDLKSGHTRVLAFVMRKCWITNPNIRCRRSKFCYQATDGNYSLSKFRYQATDGNYSLSKFHQWATNSANAEVTKRGVVDDTDCLLPVETGWGDDELKYIEGKKTVAIEATKNQAILRGENRISPSFSFCSFNLLRINTLKELSYDVLLIYSNVYLFNFVCKSKQ